MTFDQIIRDLENKQYKPVYFLMGEEPYYIDKITDYVTGCILPDTEKDFNQTILYGLDTDIETIITTARRFPMMASRQVVVVREAQQIDNIEDLLPYAENPLKSTILVINYKYKKLDKRRKLFNAIKKQGIIFESKKVYDNEIPQWINKFLNEKQFTIDPPAGMILADYLGNDLNKIVKELEKLIITIPQGENNITPEQIERNIGISKDYNNFELSKALAYKNVLKANRIINYFGSNQKDHYITATIASLYFFFSKVLVFYSLKDKSNQGNVASGLRVNYYFANDIMKAARNYDTKKLFEIIALLREYDMKSKGVDNASATPGGLLKELIYKILH